MCVQKNQNSGVETMIELKFDEKGLIPAIIQEDDTGEVLMMAYMDKEALRRTMETGTTWFWSRSRQEYWNKGATSGNKQIVRKIFYDCDKDTLLVKVQQLGDGACHTGNRTCFFSELNPCKSA
ncbi:MAG: phosphoribosyl-AMP cyclohydrolase [bacterium]